MLAWSVMTERTGLVPCDLSCSLSSSKLLTLPSASGWVAPPTRMQSMPAFLASPRSRLRESPNTIASVLAILSWFSTCSNGFGDGLTMPWSEENDAASKRAEMPVCPKASSQAALGDQISITTPKAKRPFKVCKAFTYAGGTYPIS